MYNPYLYQQYQQPQFQQPQFQQPQFQQPQSQSQDDRIYVMNRQAAESYIVAPGSFVRLWDSTEPVFYEKRADGTGRLYPLEVYEYSRKKPENNPETTENVSAIKILDERISAIESKISVLERGVCNEQHDGNDESVQSVQK